MKNTRKEPVQVSKEYVNGKWVKVGFYATKKGGVVARRIK